MVENNSRSYIEPLIESFKSKVHVNCKITSVKREVEKVRLYFEDGGSDVYDHVVFANHGDQALQLLQAVTTVEASILGAIDYSRHHTCLHYDEKMLPEATNAWEAWNIEMGTKNEKPMFTYNMNLLQNFAASVTFCVSLNGEAKIDRSKVLYETYYKHPVYSKSTIEAQSKWQEINSSNTWFAGAYWRNGFHEDGVWSGIRVAKALGADLDIFADTYKE